MRRLPGRRFLLSLHRWAGIASAVFLVLLSLTGLALNHTERLGLDRIVIHNSFVLQRYGMEDVGALESFRINDKDTISHYAGSLFYNQQPIGTGGIPVGIWTGQEMGVVATQGKLILLTREGELIEQIEGAQLPGLPVGGLGETSDGGVVLIADDRGWIPDGHWLNFSPYTGESAFFELIPVELPQNIAQSIKERYRGKGVSLYRVLLDLHSGKLFGAGGRFVMDLAAFAVLILVFSGISGWKRRARANGS